MQDRSDIPMKTVAVLGASYGGIRAAKILAQELPKGWRLAVIDRNTHFNHLYVLPRYAILPQHAHKAFIPYTKIFRGPSAPGEEAPISRRILLLQAQVTSIASNSVTLSRSFPELGIDTPVLNFDYAIYALGSYLPAPINLWGPCTNNEDELTDCGTKGGGIEWLRKYHAVIEQAPSVLVVGGGALGIQYATDIAEVFPNKSVTLLHSRKQLLPRFDHAMHEEILSTLDSLNVKTILGDRLDLTSLQKRVDPKSGLPVYTVRTQSGQELSAGAVVTAMHWPNAEHDHDASTSTQQYRIRRSVEGHDTRQTDDASRGPESSVRGYAHSRCHVSRTRLKRRRRGREGRRRRRGP
ncbi:hypothetical protein NM688_g4798 [Phlebia brevispora]|uniref:Uncharacterized protein n=1 Tax=Phlebia brevispora TaxID=194682 RepID=A0ACC1T1X5_9APHY|nr:hypothetical protein NM688_g4798 [Phlebia brevispora]